jgi:hypothetical protein
MSKSAVVREWYHGTPCAEGYGCVLPIRSAAIITPLRPVGAEDGERSEPGEVGQLGASGAPPHPPSATRWVPPSPARGEGISGG